MSETADTGQEAPKPGSDEYNEAMAAKVKGDPNIDPNGPDEVPVPPMPEGGHEKFYNAKTGEYDWANHAKELQYRLDQSKGKDKQEDEDVTPLGEDEAAQAVTGAGLDPDILAQEIMSEGDISEDHRKALNKAGFSDAFIDAQIDNYMKATDARTGEALEYVGGESEWNKINAWAQSNLTEQEQALYNQMLAGPNWSVGLDALKARYQANSKTGMEGRLMSGTETGGTSVGYQSRAEMKADMQNPKYKTDPVFRRQVMEKVQNANFSADNAGY